MDARIGYIEKDNAKSQDQVETNTQGLNSMEQRQAGLRKQVSENNANIDRMDVAISNMARSQHQGAINPDIQALINRIQVLEQAQHRQGLSEQEITKYREIKQREDDDFFLRTMSIKGFIPP